VVAVSLPKPNYRRSLALKREHPALQNMKILYFFEFFSIFVGHFCPTRSGSKLQHLKLMRIRIHKFTTLLLSSVSVPQRTELPGGMVYLSGGP
jgi:hypothetical protein